MNFLESASAVGAWTLIMTGAEKQFSLLKLQGWYSTGPQPEEADKALHKKIQEASD